FLFLFFSLLGFVY
ncbi:hypothetical protein PRSY57_0313000, partial [Plasmodium reichenowi]